MRIRIYNITDAAGIGSCDLTSGAASGEQPGAAPLGAPA
jgi:hypothetical protein